MRVVVAFLLLAAAACAAGSSAERAGATSLTAEDVYRAMFLTPFDDISKARGAAPQAATNIESALSSPDEVRLTPLPPPPPTKSADGSAPSASSQQAKVQQPAKQASQSPKQAKQAKQQQQQQKPAGIDSNLIIPGGDHGGVPAYRSAVPASSKLLPQSADDVNRKPTNLKDLNVTVTQAMKDALKSYAEEDPRNKEDHKCDKFPGLGTQPSQAGLIHFKASRKISCTHSMFYWFFEALNGNTSAPLIVWLQGGPGCPGFIGLFEEMGPFKMDKAYRVTRSPYSWNNEYAMLFLDQPVGTGFSYTSDWDECLARDIDQSSQDLFDFFVHWYKKFPEHSNRLLYISGESYAGKYVPGLAYKMVTIPEPKINLAGILVGDGLSHPLIQTKTQADSAYGFGLINSKQRDKARQIQDLTVEAINKGKWDEALYLRNKLFDFITNAAGGINAFNVAVHSDHARPKSVRKYVYKYFIKNNGENQVILNVPTNVTFRSCHMHGKHKPKSKPPLKHDIMKPVTWMLPILLKAGVRCLYYEGQFDLRDGPAQTYAWLEALEWEGKQQFFDAPRRPWYTEDGKLGGFARQYGFLADVIVAGAGHLVPFDQPKRSLEMVTRFIEGKPWYDHGDFHTMQRKQRGKRRRAPRYLKNWRELEALVDRIIGPGPVLPAGTETHGNGVIYNEGANVTASSNSTQVTYVRRNKIAPPVETPSPNQPPPGVTPSVTV